MSNETDAVNLDVPFSEVLQFWNFNYEDHYKGFDKIEVSKFLVKLNIRLQEKNLPCTQKRGILNAHFVEQKLVPFKT